ncbi:MAG: stage V sporulation protein AE [Clostridia bacterium]
MDYLWAFLIGGGICAIGQILIDKTKLTPARILTGFVCAGVFLSLIGVYDYLVEIAGAGATVPLTGFGHNLFTGVKQGIEDNGILGLLTGQLTAAAGGLGAVIVFALLAALVSKPKMKR